MMIERLADIEHKRWSGWMRYMLDNWTDENVARWKRQMVTPYADLPEHSKESNRREVHKTLEAMREPSKPMLQGAWDNAVNMNGDEMREVHVSYMTDVWQAMVDGNLTEREERS